MDRKNIFDIRAGQSPTTQARGFQNLKSKLEDIAKSQRLTRERSMGVIEPHTMKPSQSLVVPNDNDEESSSHTSVDMKESSQSSFIIRLPPMQSMSKEHLIKDSKTRHSSRHTMDVDVEEQTSYRRTDVEYPRSPADRAKMHTRSSSSRSLRHSPDSLEALEERMMRRMDEKIAESHAMEAAHREFLEHKLEDAMHQSIEKLRDEIKSEIDERIKFENKELWWSFARSEERSRILEDNQIRLIAVIDQMRFELEEMRYELGYGAIDPSLSPKSRRGELCAELYPDHYAALNPPPRKAWTRRRDNSKKRYPEKFKAWRSNPDEACHRPRNIMTRSRSGVPLSEPGLPVLDKDTIPQQQPLPETEQQPNPPVEAQAAVPATKPAHAGQHQNQTIEASRKRQRDSSGEAEGVLGASQHSTTGRVPYKRLRYSTSGPPYACSSTGSSNKLGDPSKMQ